MRPMRAAMLLALAMVLLCACDNSHQRRINDVMRKMPSRNAEAPYDGIDISSYQGYIDWNKVSSDKNIRFVFIKATEGWLFQNTLG